MVSRGHPGWRPDLLYVAVSLALFIFCCCSSWPPHDSTQSAEGVKPREGQGAPGSRGLRQAHSASANALQAWVWSWRQREPRGAWQVKPGWASVNGKGYRGCWWTISARDRSAHLVPLAPSCTNEYQWSESIYQSWGLVHVCCRPQREKKKVANKKIIYLRS